MTEQKYYLVSFEERVIRTGLMRMADPSTSSSVRNIALNVHPVDWLIEQNMQNADSLRSVAIINYFEVDEGQYQRLATDGDVGRADTSRQS